MRRNLLKLALIPFIIIAFSGCTIIFQKGRRSDLEQIQSLSSQVDELARAKNLLEERLSQEIKDKQVSLQMRDKGLVITFVGDVLFASGKAKILPEANEMLSKVARVLKENVRDLSVGIEGHTDNVPITYSGWKTNWELSTARALSVLHYLINDQNITPERLSAIGYGEYQPVASNDTKAGRQKNRRVEVVILPKTTKVKEAETHSGLQESAENLK